MLDLRQSLNGYLRFLVAFFRQLFVPLGELERLIERFERLGLLRVVLPLPNEKLNDRFRERDRLSLCRLSRHS